MSKSIDKKYSLFSGAILLVGLGSIFYTAATNRITGEKILSSSKHDGIKIETVETKRRYYSNHYSIRISDCNDRVLKEFHLGDRKPSSKTLEAGVK